jgi:hypothetical protein
LPEVPRCEFSARPGIRPTLNGHHLTFEAKPS